MHAVSANQTADILHYTDKENNTVADITSIYLIVRHSSHLQTGQRLLMQKFPIQLRIWGCCKLPIPVSPRCSPGGATTGEASKSSGNFIYKTAHFKVDCVNYFKKQFS